MVTDIKQAVRNAACPSCGAQVPIYSRASVQAVCPFCRSTLVRTDVDWNAVGEMAALADDLSPFFVGMRGKYKKVNFTIIGRLQQQFDEGVWNEWLLQLDNRRTSWLGEGSGLFYLTVPSTSTETLPEFSRLSVGQQVLLDGKYYNVSNIETARCIATQGEIPFAAPSGETTQLVDLTGEDGSFASLDYSDNQPALYTGKVVSLDEFEIETHDGEPLKQQAVDALCCAGCGNAVSLRNPASILVACGSCGMANNLSAGGKLVVAFGQSVAKLHLSIPLGSKGVLDGRSYEVIGFLRCTGGGETWDEYLLYHPVKGVRWLICAQGHWTFAQPAQAPSVFGGEIRYQEKIYKHFATYNANITSVLGEFYWKVKRGDTSRCADFICPPHILSSEQSAKEIVWSQGTYITSAEIAKAFGVNEVIAKGDGINQPSPAVLKYVVAFCVAMIVVFLVDMFVHPKNIQNIKFNSLQMTQSSTSSELVSEPFTLTAPHSLFKVHANTSVSNQWVALEYRLTNQDTGEARVMNREVAYYYGSDSDGSWSEGSTSDDAVLANVTAGNYVLEINGETDSSLRPEVNIVISATHGEPSLKNFWIVCFVLILGPLLAGFNKYYFEKRRWDASDHPWE